MMIPGGLFVAFRFFGGFHTRLFVAVLYRGSGRRMVEDEETQTPGTGK